MSVGLILGLVWIGLATAVACGKRRAHVPTGWALAALGIPVLGMVTYHHGPIWGLVAMCIGAIMLRQPLRSVLRRARRAV